MDNKTDAAGLTCFGSQVILRADKDESLIIHPQEIHRFSIVSYSLAWVNCALNVLLGAITIFYNTKILTKATGNCRQWKCSKMALMNLAVADVLVGFVVLPSCSFLLAAALLGVANVCQPVVQLLFTSLQTLLSAATFYGVVIVTIERYISVIYCMKCTVIMTRARILVATLTAWFVSSGFGIAVVFAEPRAVQLVLSIHVICLCFILVALNIKMHLVAKAQRTKICLQRRSVHRTERYSIKKRVRIHKSVAMVITTITLCYVPRSLTSFMGASYLADLFQAWTTTLFFASSSLNPFVYFKSLKKSAFSRKRAIYGSASSRYYNGCNV